MQSLMGSPCLGGFPMLEVTTTEAPRTPRLRRGIFKNEHPMTIFLRFSFGFILGGGLALRCLESFPLSLIFALSVGTVAAVWGDKFILGFMSLMRYFR